MKKIFLLLAVTFAIGLSCTTGTAIAGHRVKPLTVAVFGDWPYSTALLDNGHCCLTR